MNVDKAVSEAFVAVFGEDPLQRPEVSKHREGMFRAARALHREGFDAKQISGFLAVGISTVREAVGER